MASSNSGGIRTDNKGLGIIVDPSGELMTQYHKLMTELMTRELHSAG